MQIVKYLNLIFHKFMHNTAPLRKTLKACSIVLIVLTTPMITLVAYLWHLSSFTPVDFQLDRMCRRVDRNGHLNYDHPVILLASNYFSSGDYGEELYGTKTCRKKCLILPPKCVNYNFIVNQATALVFHAPRSDLSPALLSISRKFRRNSNQFWVLFSLESPATLSNVLSTDLATPRLDNVFNLTLSYRYDSDIRVPPSRFDGVTTLSDTMHFKPHLPVSVLEKRHLAAVISNCHDDYGRLSLLNELSRLGVQVDIYGKCSPNGLKCPGRRGRHDDFDCYEFLKDRYLFYAAFENSICRDYFTEKALTVLRYNLVPVVVGGANYTAELPPYSFIDASTFKSAGTLAHYLIDLARDENAYNMYFSWKSQYAVTYKPSNLPFCLLCQRLWEKSSITQPKTVSLKSWSLKRSKSECRRDIFIGS